MTKSKKPATPTPATTGGESKTPRPGTKFGILWDVLHRPEGASLAQMMEATGWQEHSLRGFLAGTLKKRYGLKVVSEKTEAGRVYRIAPAA